MSEGIRSGVNWMRVKPSSRRMGQGVHQQRLGQPGHAHQQAVAAGKERVERRLDGVLLADDHLGHFLLEQAHSRRELVEHLRRVMFDDGWRVVNVG